jgi:hypothetical protein
MSSLKINDLRSAQTEGYISELTETEMTVWGGCGHCGGSSLIGDITVIGDDFVISDNNTAVAVLGFASASDDPTTIIDLL